MASDAAAHLLTRDEARRIAANIAKLLELLRGKADVPQGPAACFIAKESRQ